MAIDSNAQTLVFYRKAFDESPTITGISTLSEGRFVEINRAFSRILGYTREETIGRTAGELGLWVSPLDRTRLISQVKASERVHDYEVQMRARSGRIVPFLASAEVFESDNEEYLLVQLEDITERRRSETALAVSQFRLQQISEMVQDIIYSIKLPQATADYISPSILNVLGYRVDEVLNEPDWMIQHVYPEDRDDLIAYFNDPRKIDVTQPQILRWRHKNGHTVWLEHRSALIYSEGGKIEGFIGIGRDITARKKAEDQILLNEARLESLLKISQYSDPEVQHLLDFTLGEAVQLTRSQFGYIYHYLEEREELILNTWSRGVKEACRIENPTTVYSLSKTGFWGEVIRQRKPILINDFPAAHPLKKGYPAGHPELHNYLSIPVFNYNQIVAVVGLANKSGGYDQSDVRQLTLLMDSTWKLVDQRIAAQKLEEAYHREKMHREELQKEARSRGLFIDILAHELRTPLTPILASSGMLMDVLKDQAEMERRLTLNLYNSANNLAHRLEDLLDLARYARGMFKLDLGTVDLSVYLADVVERFLPTIEQNRQYLNLSIEKNIPEAEVDALRLEQVIMNLLSNASKYSPEKSEIGFQARVEEDCLRVDVRDQGVGISQEDQERLFQPYHRVEQDRQKYPGIGLGLAVARQIVEAHGGKIWLSSQSGSGSTFSFCIPLKTKGN